MDEDEFAIATAFAWWLLGWVCGAAALHWAVGWSWWWAVPAPVAPAALAGIGISGLFIVVCIVFDEDGEAGTTGCWLVGWLGGGAALHWGLGWSLWWVLSLPLAPVLAALGVYGLFVLLCSCPPDYGAPPPQDEDFEEEDSEPEPPPASRPTHAAPVMDELAKKLVRAARRSDAWPAEQCAGKAACASRERRPDLPRCAARIRGRQWMIGKKNSSRSSTIRCRGSV